jgi:hypothetical protein
VRWLHDLFDLGENMRRAIERVKHLRGAAARSQAIVFFLICAGVASPLWYFDLDTTSLWSLRAAEGLSAGPLTDIAALIYILMLILPTSAELGLARIAPDFRMAEMFSYTMTSFDAITDWPRFAGAMQAAWDSGLFSSLGVLARPIWIALHLPLFLVATTGIELLFIVCLVCGIVCFKNSMGAPSGKPERAPAAV